MTTYQMKVKIFFIKIKNTILSFVHHAELTELRQLRLETAELYEYVNHVNQRAEKRYGAKFRITGKPKAYVLKYLTKELNSMFFDILDINDNFRRISNQYQLKGILNETKSSIS